MVLNNEQKNLLLSQTIVLSLVFTIKVNNTLPTVSKVICTEYNKFVLYSTVSKWMRIF